jgi:hypothetical protein
MRAFLIAGAALALVACGQTTTTTPAEEPSETPTASAPQTREEATAQDTCGGAAYRSLVGSSLAAVTLPADANIRVIQPDTVVTEDFRPDRINIIVDANGAITSVECY